MPDHQGPRRRTQSDLHRDFMGYEPGSSLDTIRESSVSSNLNPIHEKLHGFRNIKAGGNTNKAGGNNMVNNNKKGTMNGGGAHANGGGNGKRNSKKLKDQDDEEDQYEDDTPEVDENGGSTSESEGGQITDVSSDASFVEKWLGAGRDGNLQNDNADDVGGRVRASTCGAVMGKGRVLDISEVGKKGVGAMFLLLLRNRNFQMFSNGDGILECGELYG